MGTGSGGEPGRPLSTHAGAKGSPQGRRDQPVAQGACTSSWENLALWGEGCPNGLQEAPARQGAPVAPRPLSPLPHCPWHVRSGLPRC